MKIGPIISGVATAYQYTWVTPLGASITAIPGGSITTNMVGTYKVVSYNPSNGCASSGEVNVINGSLDAQFDVDAVSGYAPLQVNFYNNSSSSLGSGSITAYWNFANGTSSVTTVSNLSPSTTYSLPGTYTVTMYINKGACLDTAYKVIQVEIPSAMEIPNVFTPNGDNVNDLFFLKSTNLETISILIYDRWGHIVFNSVSEKGNIAWDGKNQAGKEAAEGTYFYTIKAIGKDGLSYDKKGTVSLYR